MDRTTVSGTVGAGSIPAGGAKALMNAFWNPVLDASSGFVQTESCIDASAVRIPKGIHSLTGR